MKRSKIYHSILSQEEIEDLEQGKQISASEFFSKLEKEMLSKRYLKPSLKERIQKALKRCKSDVVFYFQYLAFSRRQKSN